MNEDPERRAARLEVRDSGLSEAERARAALSAPERPAEVVSESDRHERVVEGLAVVARLARLAAGMRHAENAYVLVRAADALLTVALSDIEGYLGIVPPAEGEQP